jgi:uncharacterized repeat protein (TIGR03803 family)
LSDSVHHQLYMYALASRERARRKIMTSSRTRLFNLARSFGVGSALVVALWLATAIASPAQTFTTLVSFDGTDGANPNAGLVQGRDGSYYGITTNGGTNRSVCVNDCGTVFKITPTGTLTSLYSFCAQTRCPDGDTPYAGLVQGTDGNFYGTTWYGGANSSACYGLGCGTVFKITSGGTLTTLYSFCAQKNCTDGAYPQDRLVLGTDGNLYGTTDFGGSGYHGTVFKITPAGKLTTLRSIWPNGIHAGRLVQGRDGNFYGTTLGGGRVGGTVFKITPSGKLTTLYSFCSQSRCTDGYYPNGLLQGSDGDFYGSTFGGGAYHNSPCNDFRGCGTIFQISPAGTLTTLYSFCAQTGCPDGYNPVAVVQATDGNFYGPTSNGGANNYGTIFQITPTGTLTTLYSFCPNGYPCADGTNPDAGLVQGTNGNFYGTTPTGGASTACDSGCGTVYGLSVGLGPFVSFVRSSGKVGWKVEILGQGFKGTTGVSFDGTAANFVVHSATYLTATVPQGATTGFVTVTTPGGTLQSNIPFRVTQ